MNHCTRVILIIAIFTNTPVGAQQPAFPGADGAGMYATGGRGGLVYHVTRLDRNFNDGGPGTLRYGLNDNNFNNQPRTIVFDVGGTFWLGRYGAERGHHNGWDTQSRINLGSNVTIAGQTAPGGVFIMGGVVKAGSENVILRNLTIAPGYGMRSFEKPDENPPELPTPGDFPDSYVYDALDISGRNIMISHLTTVYATDETISANERAADITIQYCNISQGQNYPQADAEGSGYTGHALGSLLQAGSNARISVIHNLYAHLKGRLPRVGSEEGTGAWNDFRNNVFYNWFGTAGYGASGQPSFNNFLFNFYLAGPGGDNVSGINIVSSPGGTGIFNGHGASWTRVYGIGNLKDINQDGDPDDAISADESFYSAGSLAAPLDVNIGVTLSARDAFDNVLGYVGARWWERDYDPVERDVNTIDTVDERLIHETLTGTGGIMAWADDPFDDDPNEGREWRSLLALRADPSSGAAPFNRPTDWDTDQDGMPNTWEIEHDLPVDRANHNEDFDSDGYTDLEEYLNDLAAWPAPGEIVFIGTNDRYAEIVNWEIAGMHISWGRGNLITSSLWQPSRYDTAVINQGTVIVDAVGQHAGMLKLGTQTDEPATLVISEGWLKVADEVIIGVDPAASATLELSGGALYAAAMTQGTAGTFAFTRGSLYIGIVGFDLINNGGTLAVHPERGFTQVSGGLILNDGSLHIEIRSATDFDTFMVDGTAQLGGTLDVVLNHFIPTAEDVFEILKAGACEGTFTNAPNDLDTSVGTFDVEYTGSTVVLTNFRGNS